jgi:hypothetical protein
MKARTQNQTDDAFEGNERSAGNSGRFRVHLRMYILISKPWLPRTLNPCCLHMQLKTWSMDGNVAQLLARGRASEAWLGEIAVGPETNICTTPVGGVREVADIGIINAVSALNVEWNIGRRNTTAALQRQCSSTLPFTAPRLHGALPERGLAGCGCGGADPRTCVFFDESKAIVQCRELSDDYLTVETSGVVLYNRALARPIVSGALEPTPLPGITSTSSMNAAKVKSSDFGRLVECIAALTDQYAVMQTRTGAMPLHI